MTGLQAQKLVTIADAAILTWPKGKKKPKTKQLENSRGVAALGGAFWGMFFGLIFFIPFFGAAVGAVMGALVGKFDDFGIDNQFIDNVRNSITEGTSALFLLTDNAVEDRVVDALKGMNPEIIATNLSTAQEQELKAHFAS